MTYSRSACPLDCWDACGFQVKKDGADFIVRGDPNHPVTRGFLCRKGQSFLIERAFSADRIRTPLLKTKSGHTPVSWDDALALFAEKIEDTVSTYGPKAIAHYYDSGAGGLLKSLEHRFFNLLGGVTEPVGSLCWAAGLAAVKNDFGRPLCHHPQDILNSDTIVIWGRNVTETNIHLLPFLLEAQKMQKKLVVIDPNLTEIAKKADLYIQIEPATDGFLALALIKILMEKSIPGDLLARCNNYEDLSVIAGRYTSEALADITGVSRDRLHELASLFSAGKTTIYLGYGMQRYYNSGNSIRAINSLAYLSGNVGIAGGGVNYADSFVSGLINKNALFLQHTAKRRYFPKPRFAEHLLQAAEPPVKLLYVSRANPVVTLPNTARTIHAFSAVNFVVCSDTVHTDTTQMADLVLPATTCFEEEDVIFTSMWHRYINYITPVMEPRGEARPEWQVFTALAEQLGLDFPARTAREWLAIALEPLKEFSVDLD
ncbi:MAG: molybdopterin-dependent oxidoreductase, partial [Bacillota bacterium]|nr:molybdopterin-dependent oxidoreductase [Bacillota bacterium]